MECDTAAKVVEAENITMAEENANHKEKEATPRRMSEKYRKPNVTEQHKKLKAELEENATVFEGISFASEQGKVVEKFMEQLNANVKSEVDYSHFEILEKGLGKDLIMVGRFNVPLRLAPIAHPIYDIYGDFTASSPQSDCAATPSYILFCAAIKEMDDLKQDQVNETKILLWRDAINNAHNLQFGVDFAIKHLKRIARAYIGFKAMKRKSNTKDMLNNKNGFVEDCFREAKYFLGKPLSIGLFHQYYSSITH
ncbi:Fiber protein Fb17 [Gossypium australe]|uniref:Fiber protein Fb17 n=1 Tax=Gossypium australe TaxID=47621 RepID=A0A5B6VJD9_9ROSI|nr:Fiber protein Fb17 [Gossypium australe]